MGKYIIVILIALGLLATGAYLYSNSKKINQLTTQGSFSTDTQNLSLAKPTEIVELKNGDTYNLTASMVKKQINGQEVKMLAYNEMIPGPTIKVAKGSEITINFKNDTDIDTTIHSHGVRLDNQFDGTPDVTQKPVKPGEAFTYKIKFPDEGVYFYHPHIREDYAQELGLYGNYIVTPTDSNYWSPVNQEMTLTLDDILIQNNTIAPFNNSIVDHALMGRFGNTMLVNGETNYQMNIKQGDVVRYYITNTANTRTFNVSIPGVKMKWVGGDNGKVEKEEFVDSIVLGPSERAIVEVLYAKNGTYQLQHKTPQKSYQLASINVSSERSEQSYMSSFNTLRTNQDTETLIDGVRQYFSGEPDKKLTLSLDMMGNENMMQNQGSNTGGHMMSNGTMMKNGQIGMGSSGADKIEWEDKMGNMNAMSTSQMIKWKLVDQATNNTNMDIKWQFKQGDKIKLSIFNDPKSAHPMQHPIHIHGQKFLILSTNGIKNDNLVWKDTALIQNGDTVELLVDMANPGKWLIHCHIPEHMESGMMSQFEVI